MKPVRHAVSVLVRRGPEGLLAVRRPPDDDELPGVWGLPAASLREGEDPEDAVARVGRDKLGVELASARPLREGETEREGYRLRMRLYEADVREGEPSVPQPVEGVTQYVDWEWAPPGRLREAAGKGSLCSRLCLEWLEERGGPRSERGGASDRAGSAAADGSGARADGGTDGDGDDGPWWRRWGRDLDPTRKWLGLLLLVGASAVFLWEMVQLVLSLFSFQGIDRAAVASILVMIFAVFLTLGVIGGGLVRALRRAEEGGSGEEEGQAPEA